MEPISPRSIRTRLTLFYSLAVFILLALAAIFLYWMTITLLYKADYEFLIDEIDTIQYITHTAPIDQEAIKEAVEIAPKEEDGSIYRYFIRIRDANNQIIHETPGANEVFHAESPSKIPRKKRFYWFVQGEDNYLAIDAPIQIGEKNHIGYAQIALDVSYQHSLIHDRSKIIAGLLMATLLSLLFGFVIANRGLRSLFLLTQTVQKITVTSLDQRINPKSWPVELVGIGVAFNQMLDRMEASFTRLKQFSADLAHELRTPVTNLIGTTEISLSYDQSVEEYRRVMESNLEELQRISSLIENILFLSKTENPQYEVKKSHLHLYNEIALVVEFYQALADEKNISVTIHGDADMNANPDMIRRLISNLLSNAIKYCEVNGHVEITIEIHGQEVVIIFQDDGPGIAKENIPKIFDRFYRTDSARSQQVSGVGLGLSIVKSIVEIHHGSIVLESDIGRGVKVVVTLLK